MSYYSSCSSSCEKLSHPLHHLSTRSSIAFTRCVHSPVAKKDLFNTICLHYYSSYLISMNVKNKCGCVRVCQKVVATDDACFPVLEAPAAAAVHKRKRREKMEKVRRKHTPEFSPATFFLSRLFFYMKVFISHGTTHRYIENCWTGRSRPTVFYVHNYWTLGGALVLFLWERINVKLGWLTHYYTAAAQY